MSIAAIGTTQAAHTHAVAAAAATASQGAFGAQLQSWLAGQSSSAGSSGAQTASLTEPGRDTPDTGRHHHHQASSTDANVANGTSNGQAISSAPTAMASNSASTGAGASQQSSGSLLLNDMMRGLQAYGSTTAMM
jgi:hypothetical protein